MKVIRTWKTENLLSTEYHCPNCGEESVYIEDNEGDYYEGQQHYCIKCKFTFTMPSGYFLRDTEYFEE